MNTKKKARTSTADSSAKPTKRLTFEQAYSELEEVVNALESSQMGLTESLSLYQKGVGCLKVCHQALEQAERKIELLTGVNEDGQAETEPFDDDELELQAKAGARSKRRSAKGTNRKSESETPADGIDDDGRLF